MVRRLDVCPLTGRWLTRAATGWQNIMCGIYAQDDEEDSNGA